MRVACVVSVRFCFLLNFFRMGSADCCAAHKPRKHRSACQLHLKWSSGYRSKWKGTRRGLPCCLGCNGQVVASECPTKEAQQSVLSNQKWMEPVFCPHLFEKPVRVRDTVQPPFQCNTARILKHPRPHSWKKPCVVLGLRSTAACDDGQCVRTSQHHVTQMAGGPPASCSQCRLRRQRGRLWIFC